MMDANDTSQIAIDQKLARRFARLLARTPATPNGVTAFGLVIGLVAGGLLSQGGAYSDIGAAFFMLAAWFDHVDGELARLTARTSTFGHYFDHAAAMTTYVAAFVGAGFGLADGWMGTWAAPAGIMAGVSVAAIMSARVLVEIRYGREAVRQTPNAGFEIEDTLYLFGPVTWLGGLDWFVAAAAMGAPVFLLWVMADACRCARGRRRIEGR